MKKLQLAKMVTPVDMAGKNYDWLWTLSANQPRFGPLKMCQSYKRKAPAHHKQGPSRCCLFLPANQQAAQTNQQQGCRFGNDNNIDALPCWWVWGTYIDKLNIKAGSICP
jgi:hypothetical protein